MDSFIAKVQAWLTFLIVGAWVALLLLAVLTGNSVAGDYADRMKEVVMLAVGFWLLRPRASNGAGKGEEPAATPSPAAPRPPAVESFPQ